MVKTRLNNHARILLEKNKFVIDNIFGRQLTHRILTRTLDNEGQISDITTSDTTFQGHLQTGADIEQKYLDMGIIEIGEGVLYLQADELSTIPLPQDQILDDDATWEIVEQIDSPEVGGKIIFYAFRLRRRPNAADT